MNNKPLVSVVVPCRNEEKYIERCLDSILNQDYPEIEIIIADGLSEDRTKEILIRYQKLAFSAVSGILLLYVLVHTK